MERATQFSLDIEGEGAAILPRSQGNLVCKGVEAAFKAIGKETPILRYWTKNRIPFAKGLGSSSAAIVSGILAGLALAGFNLQVAGEEELLQIATNIEGPLPPRRQRRPDPRLDRPGVRCAHISVCSPCGAPRHT